MEFKVAWQPLSIARADVAEAAAASIYYSAAVVN